MPHRLPSPTRIVALGSALLALAFGTCMLAKPLQAQPPQAQHTHWNQLDLRGAVASLEVRQYALKRHPSQGEGSVMLDSMVCVFDPACVLKTHFHPNGLMKLDEVMAQSGQEPLATTTFLTTPNHPGDTACRGVTPTHERVYLQQGADTTRIWHCPAPGAPVLAFTFAFDERGDTVLQLTHQAAPQRTTEPVSITRMERDSAGKLLALRKLNSRYQLQELELLQYDSLGRLATKRLYMGPDKIASAVLHYTYNPQGQLAELTETYPSGTVVERVTYTYNPQGWLETERSERGSGLQPIVTTLHYRHDGNGNWTRREQWVDGEPELATLRAIQYHDGPAGPTAPPGVQPKPLRPKGP